MIPDAQLQFSDAQALTATAVSTNIIDLGVARRVGDGEPLVVAIAADVAADLTTGNETYQVDVQTDDNSAFSSPTVIASLVIPAARLALGKQVTVPIPNGAETERYLRLNYVLGGTTPTVTVTSFLMPGNMVGELAPATTHYPDNISVQ